LQDQTNPNQKSQEDREDERSRELAYQPQQPLVEIHGCSEGKFRGCRGVREGNFSGHVGEFVDIIVEYLHVLHP
jgi:hypothetical protein